MDEDDLRRHLRDLTDQDSPDITSIRLHLAGGPVPDHRARQRWAMAAVAAVVVLVSGGITLVATRSDDPTPPAVQPVVPGTPTAGSTVLSDPARSSLPTRSTPPRSVASSTGRPGTTPRASTSGSPRPSSTRPVAPTTVDKTSAVPPTASPRTSPATPGLPDPTRTAKSTAPSRPTTAQPTSAAPTTTVPSTTGPGAPRTTPTAAAPTTPTTR